jgi:hypothetical protein
MKNHESSNIVHFMIPPNVLSRNYNQSNDFVLPSDTFVIENQCLFINPLNKMVEDFVDFSMKVSRKNISFISNLQNDFIDLNDVSLSDEFANILKSEDLFYCYFGSGSRIEFYTFSVKFHSKYKPIVVQFFSKQKADDVYSAISKFYFSE